MSSTEHGALRVAEPVEIEGLGGVGLELKVGAELAQRAAQPLLGQIHARAQVHHRPDIDAGTGDDRNRDLILDQKCRVLHRERARRALRHEPRAQELDLIRRQARHLGDDVDLVAIRRRRDPTRDRGHLG